MEVIGFDQINQLHKNYEKAVTEILEALETNYVYTHQAKPKHLKLLRHAILSDMGNLGEILNIIQSNLVNARLSHASNVEHQRSRLNDALKYAYDDYERKLKFNKHNVDLLLNPQDNTSKGYLDAIETLKDEPKEDTTKNETKTQTGIEWS